MRRPASAAFALLMALCACAGTHRKTAAISAAQIAVLPIHNETNDADGPQIIRRLLERGIAERGYVTIPQAIVDAELSKMEIKDIDQITATELQELHRRTGANTAVAADLLDFNIANRGFSHERRVGVSIRLLSTLTGQVVWRNSDHEINKGSTILPSTAVYDYVKGWSEAALEKAMNWPLYPESSRLIARMLKTLPAFSLAG